MTIANNQPETTPPQLAAVARALSGLDAAAEAWVKVAGWDEELAILQALVISMAGRQRVENSSHLRGLIRRHGQLTDRWVREAYIEGFLAGGYARDDARAAK